MFIIISDGFGPGFVNCYLSLGLRKNDLGIWIY